MPPRKKSVLKVTTAAAKKKRPIEPEPEEVEVEEPEISEKEDEPPAASQQASAEAESQPAPKSKRTKRKALVLTEEQEVDLAEWIRIHPEIYSKGLKSYKDSGRKKKLWDDKAEELNIEYDVLRVWYESIRSKIGKLTASKSGSAAKEETDRDKFIMSNFGFLKEHISRMRGRTGMSVSIN